MQRTTLLEVLIFKSGLYYCEIFTFPCTIVSHDPSDRDLSLIPQSRINLLFLEPVFAGRGTERMCKSLYIYQFVIVSIMAVSLELIVASRSELYVTISTADILTIL